MFLGVWRPTGNRQGNLTSEQFSDGRKGENRREREWIQQLRSEATKEFPISLPVSFWDFTNLRYVII